MEPANPDSETAMAVAEDRGESVTLMEPLLVGASATERAELTDLAVELASACATLRSSLPEAIVAALAGLVRSMNCYYSNLIEGHYTHPIDIERALKDDYSSEPKQRDLQLEARAHIHVQAWIDNGGLTATPASAGSIVEIHRRFCAALPPDLLRVEDHQTGEQIPVTPGELRTCDVRVGRHAPISPGAIPRFVDRFEKGYGRLGRTEGIIALAGAHHRLLWIHPFIDGNGRVARLMSHAMLLDSLDTGGVWSISRGLARHVDDYKGLLMACDAPRRNDLDGRGQLSEEALIRFTRFFLETCLDQVRFMTKLMQPDRLRERILRWAQEEIRADRLPTRSDRVLEAVLYRGQVPRGDVDDLLAVGERQARRVTAALLQQEVLTASTSRAPLHLNFPARLAAEWMPGLFPPEAS